MEIIDGFNIEVIVQYTSFMGILYFKNSIFSLMTYVYHPPTNPMNCPNISSEILYKIIRFYPKWYKSPQSHNLLLGMKESIVFYISYYSSQSTVSHRKISQTCHRITANSQRINKISFLFPFPTQKYLKSSSKINRKYNKN